MTEESTVETEEVRGCLTSAQMTNYELQLSLHAAHQREGELERAVEALNSTLKEIKARTKDKQ
tara:strand:+ start:120 stop:308 length:189 start_codon:yes stop_codon:yes gene_type:complete